MNIKAQPLLVGLSVAGGATALIIAFTSASTASSQSPLDSASTASSQSSFGSAAGQIGDPSTSVTTAAPSSSVPVPPPAQSPITLDQARAIAERIGGGRADTAEAEVNGVYDISVVRANGTEAQFVIDGRTGRVVSNVAEEPDVQDQSEIGQPDAAEPTNGGEPTDNAAQPGD